MRELRISLNDAIPLIEERLAAGKEVLFSPYGTSMLPTLREKRDTLVLVSPPKELKKYDIALFRRQNGQYVLHRVVGRTEFAYTFIGDNQFAYERNIERERIIALCVAYLRDGKRVELDSFRCRAFARFWHYTRFARRAYRALLRRLKSIF